jgi:hypothetical protein
VERANIQLLPPLAPLRAHGAAAAEGAGRPRRAAAPFTHKNGRTEIRIAKIVGHQMIAII